MKEKTIDYILRATWMAVQKMYNEEAGKKESTMATGFALISIDPEEGTPSTALGPKMGMEATSLSRTLKNMEDKGLVEASAQSCRRSWGFNSPNSIWLGNERVL